MMNPPPIHMHGSNLLVRADVEDDVGWDFGETLAEDQLFGVKVYERYGHVFGWHGGVLFEQPPLSLRDHFQQRRRWVIGTLQNFRHFCARMKLRMLFGVFTYWFGFLSAVASGVMYAYYFVPEVLSFLAGIVGFSYVKPATPSMPIMTLETLVQRTSFSLTWESLISAAFGAALLFSLIVWLMSYQVGLSLNLRYAGIKGLRRFSLHLQQLLLGPIVGIVETYPAFHAMVEFYILRRHHIKDFHIITK
jgi:cellulose synthase/poly-beta-1,6-N-acetylglucosamine synthase-like glycosyltransferase